MSSIRQSRVFFSNTFSALVEALAENLSKPRSAFDKVSIYVGSSGLKSYLIETLASYFGIFSGIEIISIDRAIKDTFDVLSKAEMSIQLEALIRQCIEEKELFPLRRYIQGDPYGHKIRGLCDFLAVGFIRHFLSNENALQESWQREFYALSSKALFKKTGYLQGSIYVFGCDVIPEKFLDLLVSKGACFFYLSPCSLFWDDICSDKEKAFLYNVLNEKEKSTLDRYLEGQNTFLANWGFVGKYFSTQVENRGVVREDLYTEVVGSSALSCVKRNLFHMENNSYVQDDSLELHSAVSMRQEVEIMYERICQLLCHTDIKPSDIVIMAPDIDLYAPFIHTIFDVDYRIYDLEEKYAFSALFTLAFERFTKDAFFALCKEPTFLEKRGLREEDVDLFQDWIEKAGVSWGVDIEHREQIFSGELHQEIGVGTWEYGFHRLLDALVSVFPGQEIQCQLHEAEMLGLWMELIYDLKRDLFPIIEGKERTLKSWLEYTKIVLQTYFLSSQELLFFAERLELLLMRSQRIHDELFSFSSFYRLLEPEWKKGGRSFQSHHLESITCRSYSLVPAKVLCILGLDEESFPRKELYGFSDLPFKIDRDRFLFLGWILCAERHLFLSYQEQKGAPRELMGHLHLAPLAHKRMASITYPPTAFVNVEERNVQRFVDMRHMEEVARHPIRFYLRCVQNVSLKFQDERAEFALSSRTKKKILKLSLERPFDDVWQEYMNKGEIPRDPFGALVYKELSAKARKREQLLQQCGIRQVFSFPLTASEPFCITGKLSFVSDGGMIVEGKATLQNCFKAWPAFLVFCLKDIGEKRLLFIDDGKQKAAPGNVLEAIGLFFEYMQFAKERISFLMPDWASAFFKGKEIEENVFKLFYDPYVSFLERREKHGLPVKDFFSIHGHVIQRLFAPFIAWSIDEKL